VQALTFKASEPFPRRVIRSVIQRLAMPCLLVCTVEMQWGTKPSLCHASPSGTQQLLEPLSLCLQPWTRVGKGPEGYSRSSGNWGTMVHLLLHPLATGQRIQRGGRIPTQGSVPPQARPLARRRSPEDYSFERITDETPREASLTRKVAYGVCP
jgi:hypothetical protein